MKSLWRLPRTSAVLLAIAILLASLSAPATAHKEHKQKQPVAEQVAQPAAQRGEPVSMQSGPAAMHGQMGEMMEEKERLVHLLDQYIEPLQPFGDLLGELPERG